MNFIRRKQIAAMVFLTHVAGLGLLAAGIIYILQNDIGKENLLWGITYLMFMPIVIGSIFAPMLHKVKYKARTQIQTHLFTYINPNLIHEDDYQISPETFDNSRIFQKSYETFDCNSYFSGKISGNDVEIADVIVKMKSIGADILANGTPHEIRTTLTLFRGKFLYGRINSAANIDITIYPKQKRARKHTRKIDNAYLVKPSDNNFDRHFYLYSTNKTQAHAIILSNIQHHIAELYLLTKLSIYIQIHHNQIFILATKSRRAIQSEQIHYHGILYQSRELTSMYRAFSPLYSELDIDHDVDLMRIFEKILTNFSR